MSNRKKRVRADAAVTEDPGYVAPPALSLEEAAAEALLLGEEGGAAPVVVVKSPTLPKPVALTPLVDIELDGRVRQCREMDLAQFERWGWSCVSSA